MIVECPGCQLRYDVSGRPAHTRARCRCGTVFELPPPPRSADYLQCPQCAAAVEPGAARCAFCEAALMVKACPRCFGRMFYGAKHCRHCGAAVEVAATAPVDGDAAPRSCPRCRPAVSLEGRLVEPYLIDECNQCHGIFVDAATLERLLKERREAAGAWAEGFSRVSVNDAPPPQPGPVYVRCPDCDQLMNRTNFGKASGVIVDVCNAHGTWFDADELPRIIAFVNEGGLEKAARREVERLREDARRAKAAAAAPVTVGAHAPIRSHRLRDGGDVLGAVLVGVGGLLGGLFD